MTVAVGDIISINRLLTIVVTTTMVSNLLPATT